MARQAFSLRIDPDLLAGARQAAAIRGCSVNEFIVDAVARAVAALVGRAWPVARFEETFPPFLRS